MMGSIVGLSRSSGNAFMGCFLTWSLDPKGESPFRIDPMLKAEGGGSFIPESRAPCPRGALAPMRQIFDRQTRRPDKKKRPKAL
jgi:hypothetical protein